MSSTAQLKIYPEILFAAARSSQPSAAYRAWFLAKGWDRVGAGFIPARPFQQHLVALGVSDKTSSRWLLQAHRLSLLQRQAEILRIASWQAGALLAGLRRLGQPVHIRLTDFLSQDWMAYCWAGYLLRFCSSERKSAPLSRARLEELSGVPPRTQYTYERKAGVVNQPNFASFGNIDANPELAIWTYARRPFYSKEGEVRRRLPNSRSIPGTCGISLANRGRLKKVNAALRAHTASEAGALYTQEDSSPHPDHPHNKPAAYRLYCHNAAQARRAQKKAQKADGDAHTRPAYLYHLVRTRGGKGIYQAEDL